MGVPWLMYWSDEYQADFYLNAREGTEQWEEPNGADEDVDAGKLADKKTLDDESSGQSRVLLLGAAKASMKQSNARKKLMTPLQTK